jgi:pimeloyl-ACP methyl ester carboxylesterase
MGFSLGTGVATEMATRGHGRALVLLAPYTTIPAVAQRHSPIFPMGLLMRDRFDTLSKAPSIKLPVFVAHGDQDEVVPFDMGETVAHAFPKGQFNAVSGASHMTLFARDEKLFAKIVDFIITTTPL